MSNRELEKKSTRPEVPDRHRDDGQFSARPVAPSTPAVTPPSRPSR